MTIATATGCAHAPLNGNYPDRYLQTLDTSEGFTPDASIVAGRFIDVYRKMSGSDFKQRIEAAYAQDLYFSDTIETHTSLTTLIPYLVETGEKVSDMRVESQRVLTDGKDLFIFWVMDLEFKALGSTRRTRSIGVSHLQVNEQQKIIMQQDYWDGAEGIYRQIPILGRLIPGE